MDNDQKACIYLDHNAVIKKTDEVDGMFKNNNLKATYKNQVLIFEPVDHIGALDEKTIYFKNTFYDTEFLKFILAYMQSRNVHGIVLAKIKNQYIDAKVTDEQLRELLGGDLDNSNFIKSAKDYNNALDMIADSPLYNPERIINEDKHYQENMKAIGKIYKDICEKCEPEIYPNLDALTAVYEENMLSVIYKIAFKQGYLVAAEIYKNLYDNRNEDFEVFEFDEDDDEWF